MTASTSDVQILIDIITFLASVGVSMFVAGMRWGEIRQDVKSINERMGKIEGMFVLRLREDNVRRPE